MLFKSPDRISKDFPLIKIKITDANDHSYDVEALLDSGATSLYISKAFVDDHQIPSQKLNYNLYTYNADDTLNSSVITHQVSFVCHIRKHKSKEQFYVTDLGSKTMIIGMTWLRSHNPVINWRSGSIEFSRCPKSCGITPTLDTVQREFDLASTTTEYPTSDSINRLRHSINAKMHAATEWAIEDYKSRKVLTLEDIKAGPFADYADVFEDTINHTLPPHRSFDHRIELIDGWKHWPRFVYKAKPDEKDELNKFIDDMKTNGFIRDSSSPFSSPVFFIAKKDGKKRLVVDYRELNKITKKVAYPIPHIDTLIQKWRGCKYFCSLDIRSAYYNILVHEPDIPKTAFTIERGHFEWLVMPFGLCNAPATFQSFMDNIFIVYHRRGDTSSFFDDITIGSCGHHFPE